MPLTSKKLQFDLKEFKGSRLRCLQLTSLHDEEVARFLTGLITPHGKIDADDIWRVLAACRFPERWIGRRPREAIAQLIVQGRIDPSAPPRWLLIRREATIPDSADGQDRWWLDHLLLDQFGIPTLVEVKRSTDTRIRREVVGQMLDYVANAQAYWAAGRMRQMLADALGSPEVADSHLAEYLGVNDEPEAMAKQLGDYWNRVEANMREGNVRLLFVADELPRELKRLIEFLNEQFTKIEVLGITAAIRRSGNQGACAARGWTN